MTPLSPPQLESMLAGIADRLKAEFGPCRFYVFGSYAYGRPDGGSDLDLLVVVPDAPATGFDLSVRAVRALRGIRFPKDVVVRTESEFQRRSAWLSSIERTVRDKGRLLHAA